MTSARPSTNDLKARLQSGDPSVRRIAAADLVRLGETDPAATAVLSEQLPSETDEKAAVAIIRHLGRVRHIPSKPFLWSLYESTATPARVAHAAILAHDAIDVWERAGKPTMVACRAGPA